MKTLRTFLNWRKVVPVIILIIGLPLVVLFSGRVGFLYQKNHFFSSLKLRQDETVIIENAFPGDQYNFEYDWQIIKLQDVNLMLVINCNDPVICSKIKLEIYHFDHELIYQGSINELSPQKISINNNQRNQNFKINLFIDQDFTNDYQDKKIEVSFHWEIEANSEYQPITITFLSLTSISLLYTGLQTFKAKRIYN